MFVLFALLSLAHAACPIVGGLCSSISGNTCQIEGGDTQKIVCDLDRMGAGDGAYYVWLTVYYSGATFDRIQGQDANGSAFCCDASRMGSTSPLESLKIYSVDNEVPATGYAWSNVIDASQARVTERLWIIGGIGPDKLTGQGNYVVDPADPDNTISGGAGDDEIYGGNGYDDINAGDGDDYVEGAGGADTILACGFKDKHILAEDQDDIIYGGDGSDHLEGCNALPPSRDWIDGGADADTILGWNGDDVLCGGSGTDDLKGGRGEDWVYGGADADVNDGGTNYFAEDDTCENDSMVDCESPPYATSCPAFP